ncbi:hypothetical protein Ccar_03705 [Clostridium carboxidivorans P7]|uniref:Uncharacterized protein n=1 Tax=Clostridium carboxidivorans P7 TaxID=536227 RepID=C6PYT3_9CLOT|nr:hypothetical protein [Clostridium carboxidivorans]AKN29984.1 hypothetical protein Ccar_03705 [Clostridium carboxidivorans P7]EET85614.1 hypothetical protein CcarbDRAFT_3950 [Clostridium carboxidivorans P7]
MGRFFIDSDFEAFDGRFGASDNEKIIANRVYVVNNRFKVLHETNLKKFFLKYDLHAHCKRAC